MSKNLVGGMLDSEFEQGTVFRVVKQMVGKNREQVVSKGQMEN